MVTKNESESVVMVFCNVNIFLGMWKLWKIPDGKANVTGQCWASDMFRCCTHITKKTASFCGSTKSIIDSKKLLYEFWSKWKCWFIYWFHPQWFCPWLHCIGPSARMCKKENYSRQQQKCVINKHGKPHCRHKLMLSTENDHKLIQ